MIKMMLFTSRNPDMTVAEFRAHYQRVHMPLALRCMPKIVRYQFNFLNEPLGWEPEFDAVVELWFDLDPPWSQARLAVSDDAGRAAMAEDEALFLDRAKTRICVMDELQGFP